jgi:hypothetical protein
MHYFIIRNTAIEAQRVSEPDQKVHSASNASSVSRSGTDYDSRHVRRHEKSERGAFIIRLKHSKRSLLELSDPECGGTAHLQNVGTIRQSIRLHITPDLQRITC